MRSALTVVALAAAACSPCGPSAEPSFQIGTGEASFQALDPNDPTLELVYGPQGGWHVVLAFEAEGFEIDGISSVDAIGVIDGEEVAITNGSWITFDCDDGVQRAWNTFLVFQVADPTPLHRAELSIWAQITDPRDVTAESEVVVTVVDPTRGD